VSLPPALGTTFYFDLGSPYAYLAAERLAGERLTAAPAEPVAWQAGALG
jgi:2-hydroxychromene-2-carboxylate isomerase